MLAYIAYVVKLLWIILWCVMLLSVAVQMALCRTYHKYSVEGVAATAERYAELHVHVHVYVYYVYTFTCSDPGFQLKHHGRAWEPPALVP